MTRTVIIESPYFGVHDACRYLACCGLDCIERGEVPLASHSFLPLCLPEHVLLPGRGVTGRELGLECGEAIRALVKHTVFYVDLGWSAGMIAANKAAALSGTREDRTLRGRALEIWNAGDWPSLARLTPNH
jgi:hypothetical protein